MKNCNQKLSIIILCSLLCLASVGCDRDTRETAYTQALLGEGQDAGDDYIDGFVFLGESTTYHLKSRGVLSGGRNTTQVWSNKLGTINLDSGIAALSVVYPETEEEMPIADALQRKRPARMLLTFGLNGAVEKIARGEQYFKKCYLALIDVIRVASPETDIILQSCFPIGRDMDMSAYSVDAFTLCDYIDTINIWALELAEEQGLKYLNTAEILKDGEGFLREEYAEPDHCHLNTEAYEEILLYIRTHPHEEEV